MLKNKKARVDEKYFMSVIHDKNEVIKQLVTDKDELLKNKCALEVENNRLKKQLESTTYALNELSKLNNLYPGEIKAIVSKAVSMNRVVDLLTIQIKKNISLGGY